MEVSRKQGLVAGETIVVQVLSLLSFLILALLMYFFHWVYWCEVFHWGGAQLECKVYNWKVHSPHIWWDQIEVTTIWVMDFPIVHFTFYPCKILPESRHQKRHSSSIDLVRYASCGLSNVHLYTCKPLTSGKFYGRGLFWTFFDKCYRVTGDFIHLHIMYGPPLTLLEEGMGAQKQIPFWM